MDSFFENIVKAKFSSREQSIKQSLIDTLSDNAKEIQYELKEGATDEACGKFQYIFSTWKTKIRDFKQYENWDFFAEQLYLCDHTQSLCATIEAIFLHGLKDSFLWQTINILAGTGPESNRRPSPTFWAPLLIFSHKYAIEQIHSMPQISTEIGYCRCWIRQSLNDCLLSSYLSNMRKSTRALAPYYQRTAFLRDSDFMELAESLIGGLEACVSFELPLNSSLLNQWTDLPLQLSGLYTPSLQSFPIASGIDVANNSYAMLAPVSPAKIAGDIDGGTDERSIPIPKPLQTNEFFSASIHNSPFKESTMPARKTTFMRPYVSVEEVEEPTNVDIGVDCFETIDDDIEHDVQLNALLSRVDAMEAAERNESPQPSTSVAALLTATDNNANATSANDHLTQLINHLDKQGIIIETEDASNVNVSSVMTNSLVSRMGWSSNEEKLLDASAQIDPPESPTPSHSRSLSRSSSLNIPKIDHFSYSSLLRRGGERAQTGDKLFTNQIDFDDVWQRFESTLGIGRSTDNEEIAESVVKPASDGENNQIADSSDDDEGLLDFEIVQSDTLSMHFSMAELQQMVQQTFKIARELGLDSQNFACLSCGNPLGVGGSGYTTTQ